MREFKPIWGPFRTGVADTEMGLRIRAAGGRIHLAPELEVEHLKRHSLRTLLSNDFVIPFMFARVLLAYRRGKPVAGRSAFSHASLAQTLATAMPVTALLLLLPWLCTGSLWWAGASFLAVGLFYAYWAPFLRGIRDRGWPFVLAAAALLPVDATFMFAVICLGLMYGLVWREAAAGLHRAE